MLNCYSKDAVITEDVTDTVSASIIFAKWADTIIKPHLKENKAEGEEEEDDEGDLAEYGGQMVPDKVVNMLEYGWEYESKFVNGPNQYGFITDAGYKVIIINNVKGHGNWNVTSEIKDSTTHY